MLHTIKKLIKDLITENDGSSYCPIRVFAFVLSFPAVIIFLAGYTIQLIHGHFDGQGFSTAFATMTAGFAAFGASVAMKAFTDNRQ
jgi:hypothetical protein